MINKNINLILVMIFVVVLLGLSSCNDMPTNIGETLMKDTVVVETLSEENAGIIQSTEAYQTLIKSYTSYTTLIGKSGETQAVYLFRMLTNMLPDSIGDVTVDKIVSANLILEVAPYAMGDLVNGKFSVDVKEVTKYWSKIENDSIQLTTYNSLFNSPADYFGRKIGEFNNQINISKTNFTDEISIPLDPAYIKDILQKKPGTNELVKNEGIAIIPRSDCDIIHQFITYVSISDKDTMSRIELVYQNLSGGLDTAKILIANDGLFTSAPSVPEGSIVVQENVDYRTEIKLDLSKITKYAGVIKTELILTLDTDNSYYGNEGLDSTIYLGVFAERDNTSPISTYAVEGVPDSTGKFIFSSLSAPIQYIIRHGGKGSIVIYPGHGARNSYTNNKIDRMVFFGKNATDPKKRPLLRIAYSYVATK
ncbi:MAG: hypothetical protein WCR42_13825 [bacterium]